METLSKTLGDSGINTSEINSFTVIIPTYNRGEIALNTVKELEKQSYPSFQVIVVDQSQEAVPDLVNYEGQHFNYTYHHINKPGLPNARNVGIELTTTEFAIFLDDDCIPEVALIKEFNLAFQGHESTLALVGGRVIEKGSNIFHERASLTGGYVTRYGKTLKNFDTDASGECEWAAGGNFSVRVSVFKEVGGFDHNFIGTAVMEDSDFGYAVGRKGYKIRYTPGPVMEHLRIPTGGLRQADPAAGMLYRAHNSVYFFRKYQLKRYLPVVTAYLYAVAAKDWLTGKHGIAAFYYCSVGLIRGFRTELRVV